MQKLQLSIPEPCHENWQKMTATEQGRFCNACAKEVVDFSSMTDIQVLNYFSTLTHQKVCGRALPEQLNRPISRPDTPKKRLFWYWNYIVMFFMFFGKAHAAKAQGSIKAITEVSPSKHSDIINVLAGRVGLVSTQTGSRVITGKVTDIEGNPVSFASVKIKGSNTSVHADANGSYSIKVNPGATIVIAAVSFKSVELDVGAEKLIATVLHRAENYLRGEIVIVSRNCWGNRDNEYYGGLDGSSQVAKLQVKDEATGKAIPNADLILHNDYSNTVQNAVTNEKGFYKIKTIQEFEQYDVKVSADGYEPAEFTISGYDFKDRKKGWEVLLRKEKATTMNPVPEIRETVITKALCVKRIVKESKPLFVVDGIIMRNGADINPDDLEDISVLQGPAASALFGSDGVNGAIVITTRKTKEKTLDTFSINTGLLHRKISCGIGTSYIKEDDRLLNDQGNKANEFLIFPNPVQRGEQFNISLQIKQTGPCQILITDVMGRIVLQKQLNIVTKAFTEKMIADTRWGSGLYYISIFDNKNKLINKSGFIVK